MRRLVRLEGDADPQDEVLEGGGGGLNHDETRRKGESRVVVVPYLRGGHSQNAGFEEWYLGESIASDEEIAHSLVGDEQKPEQQYAAVYTPGRATRKGLLGRAADGHNRKGGHVGLMRDVPSPGVTLYPRLARSQERAGGKREEREAGRETHLRPMNRKSGEAGLE